MSALRRDTDLSIGLLQYMAETQREGYIPIRRLAAGVNAPLPFAQKAIQKLRRAGIVKCRPGPAGGAMLAMEPEQIEILRVIEAVQGRPALRPCLVRSGACPNQETCRLSDRLSILQERFEDILRETTLADLLASDGPARPQKEHGQTGTGGSQRTP